MAAGCVHKCVHEELWLSEHHFLFGALDKKAELAASLCPVNPEPDQAQPPNQCTLTQTQCGGQFSEAL